MKGSFVRLAGFLALLATAPLAGQTPGSIEGHVVNVQDGRGLTGVAVELLLAGAPDRSTASREDGVFGFDGVPAGTHRVRVRHIGFHLLEREVDVQAGETLTLRLELTPTTVDLDTLRVFASRLAIRREDTEFTSRIDREAMQLLPTPYDVQDMVFLTPGAAPGRIWGGAADEANLYQVDGLARTHPGSGGPLVAMSPIWLEAIEVRGLGAGAEHGNFQGGIVNAVTRSGTETPQGSLRASMETHGLNASNIVEAEIGRERAFRAEVEGHHGGPIGDRALFYFAGGHLLREDTRARSAIPGQRGEFLSHRDERTELRGFGKLTWRPSPLDRIDLSGGIVDARAENHALTGYETPDAAPAYRSPGRFYQAGWTRDGERATVELRASGASSREEIRPEYADRPSVRAWVPGDPPSAVYRNAPFLVEQRPSSHSFTAQASRGFSTGSISHRVLVGGELTRSSWMDRRTRTAGLTWRPTWRSTFEPDDPSTWGTTSVLPSDWGGEVDLHAETGAQALFVQAQSALHPRLSINPGVRLGRWSGDLLPGGDRGRRIEAIRTRAWEPRVGVTFDPLGTNELVMKAHWGRYHQSLLAPFFDRAEGGQVFTNRELWYYRGTPFDDPGRTFTPGERDAMTTGDPRFELQDLIRLNEEGPVAADIRQPHVDQWIVAVERTFGPRVRVEALVVDRRNRNMIALRDRNLEDNYHTFENVQVLRAGRFLQDPDTLYFGDEPLTLPELRVSNDWIRQLLIWQAQGEGIPVIPPPGFTPADTMWLSFEQDFVLENIPEATRHLRQIQLSGHLAYPRWGASGSVVYSWLRGNFHSVTGYEAGTDFEQFWELGAGPFVRPNEQVNFSGPLPGFTPLEVKLAVHGELPWGLRGGAFLHLARGERFTPHFTLTGAGFEYLLRDDEGNLTQLDPRIHYGVRGQRVLLQPRGTARYEDRGALDLRVERELPFGRGAWRVTADVFNVTNAGAVTRVNESGTRASLRPGNPFVSYDPSSVYLAVWERQPPRTLRIGIQADF